MFTLKIETDNDAFLKDADGEIARILYDVARAIRENGAVAYRTLHDFNGNTVGEYIYVD